MTFHNVIILIKQVVNKNENKYYSNIFLENGSLKDKWVFAYYKCYIDISEGTDVNKTSMSKESHVCHYWYFISYGFKFQTNVCSRCHDLPMMSINLNNIVILNIKGFDYCFVISLIIKYETINFMQNADLTKKSGTL